MTAPPLSEKAQERALTLVELLARSVARHAAAPAIGVKRSGAWQWTSYRQLGGLVGRLAAGLAAAGVHPGDRVALVSDNRLEWAVTAFAVAHIGATLVPVMPAQHPDEVRFILGDSGAKIVVCATNDLFERLAELPRAVPTLKQRIGIELPPSDPSSYQRVLDEGREAHPPKIAPAPDDPACILYTSGTTGSPKGVMLSHRSICSNVDALLGALPLRSSDSSLAVLPWALSFGLTCELCAMLRLGASIALSSSPDKVVSELAEAHPTVLVAVPRMVHQLHDVIQREVAAKPQVIRTLFNAGVRLCAARRGRKLKLAERLAVEAAERTVFPQVLARIGGKLRYVFCGGATLAVEVGQFFEDIGLPIYEGYGLTEAGPVVSTNRPGAQRLGTVGRPIHGVSVEIDRARGQEDGQGEVVVRGPGLMSGYLDRPEATVAALVDGALRTGDVGFVDNDGYLHITGRLRDEYKLQNGKLVVPTRLEEELRMSPYITAAMVYGEGRAHNVALVVVDVDALSRWASERDLHFASTAEMLASDRVKSHIMAEIGEHSARFKGYERIRNVALVSQSALAEDGLLTPSLGIRRGPMLAKHAELIASLYGE